MQFVFVVMIIRFIMGLLIEKGAAEKEKITRNEIPDPASFRLR